MKLQSYNDIKVTLLRATPYPGSLLRATLDVTMKRDIQFEGNVSQKTLKFLVDAEHTSLLEHTVYTFYLEGVSRSFLAQITRHRIASYTSASQHYQDYREYPMVVHPEIIDNQQMRDALLDSLANYEVLVDEQKIPVYEARQVLPNAAAVNLFITINARSLINLFRLRACKRNVEEMQTVIAKIGCLIENHWPEFKALLGPPCYMDGKCNQGRMSCGKPFRNYKEIYGE